MSNLRCGFAQDNLLAPGFVHSQRKLLAIHQRNLEWQKEIQHPHLQPHLYLISVRRSSFKMVAHEIEQAVKKGQFPFDPDGFFKDIVGMSIPLSDDCTAYVLSPNCIIESKEENCRGESGRGFIMGVKAIQESIKKVCELRGSDLRISREIFLNLSTKYVMSAGPGSRIFPVSPLNKALLRGGDGNIQLIDSFRQMSGLAARKPKVDLSKLLQGQKSGFFSQGSLLSNACDTVLLPTNPLDPKQAQPGLIHFGKDIAAEDISDQLARSVGWVVSNEHRNQISRYTEKLSRAKLEGFLAGENKPAYTLFIFYYDNLQVLAAMLNEYEDLHEFAYSKTRHMLVPFLDSETIWQNRWNSDYCPQNTWQKLQTAANRVFGEVSQGIGFHALGEESVTFDMASSVERYFTLLALLSSDCPAGQFLRDYYGVKAPGPINSHIQHGRLEGVVVDTFFPSSSLTVAAGGMAYRLEDHGTDLHIRKEEVVTDFWTTDQGKLRLSININGPKKITLRRTGQIISPEVLRRNADPQEFIRFSQLLGETR